MSQITVEGPDGRPVVPKADEDGALKVSTGDGSGIATEETLAGIKEDTAALAETITAGQPVIGDPKLAVGIATSVVLPVEIVSSQTATATPDDSAVGIVTRLVGLAPAVPVGESGTANPVTVLGVAEIAGTVSQGRAGEENWLVTDAATQAAIGEVRDRLPVALEGGRLAVETELNATGDLATEATAASTLAAVGTLVAQEATTAKDASVDGLEALAAIRNAYLAILAGVLNPYSQTTFGQVRVATRQSQFDNTQEYALDTRAWGTSTATGGTVAFNTTTGRTDIAVTGSSGSIADLRTHDHFVYQPAAVTRIIMTIAHEDLGQTNQVREWGFFNGLDGIGWRLTGTDLSIFRRTSTGELPANSEVPRATWTDQYSGLIITNGNRYEIDLQWLAFGKVRFWINGALVHILDFTNALPLPYIRTAQLPLGVRIENTGASVASSIHYVCSAVYLDGGTALKFVPNSRALTAPKTGIGTTYTPVIGMRMAATINGRINRKIIIPTRTRVSNASGRATVAVILNPTSTTGGSWTQVNAASGVEYNEGITSYTGGTEISRLFLPNTNDTREFDGTDDFALNGVHLRRDAFNTTGDTMLFVAKADVGTTDIDIIARWQELG